MSDFYIVPPRLIVGSLDRSNVVTSLNTLRGDLSFKVNPETGLTLNIASGTFTFSIQPDYYVKKSGDTINSNIIFQPSNGNYGLAVGSGTSDPSTGIPGALFYNTNSDVLKVYDGLTWNEIASTGTTGITVSFADNRYLRLDGSNVPTGAISMGSQFLRFANLTTRALAGTAGQVYFNTDTNKLDLYDGSSWVPVGSGITGLFAGVGVSVSTSPITNTGSVSVNQSYNFNWTGTHTHSNPITFAPNQQFDASKLTIAYEVAGDILTFSGTAWTRLAKGGPNTLLGVHCCGGDLEYKTLVAGAGILISYQGSSIFLASTGGTGSGGSGGSGTGFTFYDKGDLLVGLGSTLYKLPVGPNKRFYLHSNSDTVSGVAWTTTVGMAITSIAPSSTVSYYGDLWYNTADGTLNVYYNDLDTSQWVEVVSGGAFSQVYQGVNYGIPFYVNSGTAITSDGNFTNVGSGVSLLYTTQSTSPSSGALVVSGGVGVGGSLFIGGATQIEGTTNVSALGWQGLVGSFGILSNDFRALVDDITVGSLVNLGGFANVGNAFIGGTTTITNNTPSFSYDTGALVVYGGVGVGGTLFVSPLKASSVSGVKLFNGVVSQASWQGNTIQQIYGGTGYSTFAKGDILVGTGTSLLKLSLGTNNQVLAVDTSSATGLTWTLAPSGGFAAVGITSLNDISVGQQYLVATFTGNTFGFSSSGSTHTLNIPVAGSGTTGLISTSSQTLSGSKTFSSNTIVSSATDATNTSSGALVVTGGAGFGKSVFIGGDLDVAGDMFIRGTMTTINTVNLTVDDKNIEIGAVDTPTDMTAEGGGITLKGATDKTIVWNAGIGWSFNNPVNVSDGNTFKIGNTIVLSSTTLGVGVTNSSLTSVGTLISGTWNANTITVPYGGTGYTNYSHSTLLVGSGSSFIRLAAGVNDQVLTVDSSTSSGYKWAYASGLNSNGTLTAINGIGVSQQYLVFGYSGTLPNIVSSGSTHTFNIPIAGVGSTGLVSTLAQTFSGNKTFTGSVYITDTTSSTSSTSGALVVSGGVAIAENAYVDNNLVVGNGYTGSLYFERAYMGSAGASQIPYMAFIGQTNLPITLRILPDNTLSYEANYGQILSLSNSSIYDTWIYRVNDISGMPLIRASNDGVVALSEYGGSVGIGKSNPSYTLDVVGNVNVAAGYNFLIDGIPISAGSASSGIYSLNNLTSFIQYFSTGTSGNEFNISSVGYTHTFNIPIAGVGKTGLVNNSAQTFGGVKTFSNGLISSSGATIYGNLYLPDNPLAAIYGGTGYSSYTKGDLLVGVGSTFVKLGVGSNNQALLADNSTASGLRWGTVSGGGGSGSGLSLYISETAPLYANTGDLWFNSETALLSVNYSDIDSTQWVEIGVNLAAIENITNIGIGITKLNNLGSSSQYFTTGTTGSGFNITSSGSYHFFNIPIASTASTGLVSGLAQTFGGNKTFANGIISSAGATIYGNLYLPDNPLASIYGGTGYSNYNLGDLIVGAGSSTIKLGKGPDRYVLQSNPAFSSGLGWTNASGGVAISTVPPSGPFAGDLWWNSGDGSLSVFYDDVDGDGFWVEIEHGPGTGTVIGGGGSGSTGIVSINGLTDLYQYLRITTTGNEISVSSLGSTHTINIPLAGSGISGLVSTGSQSFTGSKTFLSPIIGDINGSSTTSGYATSSGTATTATYAHNAGYATTSGLASTSSYSFTSGYGITAGLANTSTYSHQSGYAITSGSSNTSGFASTATYANQSGYAITSGLATTSTYSFASGSATTALNISINSTSSNQQHSLIFSNPGSGSGIALSSKSTISFNPSTNILSTSGLAITASTASTSTSTGALIVTGGVGVGGTLNSSVVSISSTFDILASNLTTSSTSLNQVVHSISASSYRTLKYTVQITSGSDYNAQEILLLHDGSTVFMTEYAQILAGSGLTLSTFDADINSGNVRLLVSPTNAVTTYNLSCTAMRI